MTDSHLEKSSLPGFPPVRAVELFAVAISVLICDLTIYRGNGYFGLTVMFLALPIMLALGSPLRKARPSLWVMALLLAGVVARLAWCGSGWAVLVGLVCLVGYAMTLVGLPPYMTRVLGFASHLIASGHRGLNQYVAQFTANNRWIPRKSQFLSIGFPLLALLVFGSLFVLANPDLVKVVGTQFEQLVNQMLGWLKNISLLEIPFCIATGWLVIGLLRPTYQEPDEWGPAPQSEALGPAPLFEAFRNTLVMVVGLFAAYLVFEFRTLWFREFPVGFHYSGYAHQGAAWLTVALGLATVLLSVIFQGQILNDPRLGRLKTLAWVWSAENFVLAIAVMHRLSIYVDFNGMTRMRMVGWLGIASVVVGFLLVVIKIAKGRDFRWLLRRELWTVSFAAYLYFILPVDRWITQYNVRQILAGHLAPSVQISEHPLSTEGYLELLPLLKCQDEIIRRGITAMLFERKAALSRDELRTSDWTARQIAEDQLDKQLLSIPEPLYNHTADFEAFQKYAYQWY